MYQLTRTGFRRALALLVLTPLFVAGLPAAANAATGSIGQVVVDPPEPPEPPPPCPQRTDFTKDIALELQVPVEVERRPSGSTYLVVFTLQSSHAFNPPDPNGCTGSDGVTSKPGSSINVVDGPTVLQDGQTAVKEITPGDLTLSMLYHFKVRFQKNFNVTGLLDPKRDARWCLIIPVLSKGEVRYIQPQPCP